MIHYITNYMIFYLSIHAEQLSSNEPLVVD